MKSLLTWIYNVATAIGGPGVFVIAFLDSSFLSFPQANDLLIVLMVARSPTWMVYYATLATLGSLAGCLALYFVARRGGEAFLRRRVSGGRGQWGIRVFQRYGVLAILVPSILPPPAPFKLFVLLAGAAQMPVWRFSTSILVGRGVRYFGVGLLTVWYGELAMAYLQAHGRTVARVVALTIVGAVLLYLGVRRWRRRDAAAAGAGEVPDGRAR